VQTYSYFPVTFWSISNFRFSRVFRCILQVILYIDGWSRWCTDASCSSFRWHYCRKKWRGRKQRDKNREALSLFSEFSGVWQSQPLHMVTVD